MSLPAHSPLGASGAERWLECPGSTRLIQSLGLAESDEPDYRADGTTAHAGAAYCLSTDLDAWEIVGKIFEGRPFTVEMAEAVQVYLDYCRSFITEDCQVFIEYQVYQPDVHKHFFGTVDFCCINQKTRTLIVVDYKHGEGILVEVKENPQPRYYAFGMLQHPDAAGIENVTLAIVQPRILWHGGGPTRAVDMSSAELAQWVEATLVPGMIRAEADASLMPGKHCRFCPAMLVCPVTSAAFRASATAGTDPVAMTDQALDLEYGLLTAVRMRIAKVDAEALKRALRGSIFKTCKLVQKRADRVYKDGAEARFKAEFGDKAYSAPALLTPPQMENLGAGAAALVKEWAYKPDTGFTLAPMTDGRTQVTVQPSSEVFSKFLEKLET